MADFQNQKERLKTYISYIGLSNSAFEKSIGLSNGYINSMRKGIGYDVLEQLSNTYKDLNMGWLITGEGSMLKGEDIQPTEKATITKNAIKYYPSVNGSMGGIEFLDDPDELSTDIILPGFSECKFAVNAYGDSMYPVIKSGQIVIMMAWTERFIDWGHIYMVVTKSGYRAIKYLKPSKQEGFIMCESENKENNPAFEIEMEDIHRLYLIKGWICRDAI